MPERSSPPVSAVCHDGTGRGGQPTVSLYDIERYLAATGMKPSGFGRQVCGDPAYVSRLREGGTVSARMAGKIVRFITANPPNAERKVSQEPPPTDDAQRVFVRDTAYASSCLRDKTLAAIELFAAQWRISFADAQVLLLDTGVRLPGKRRVA